MPVHDDCLVVDTDSGSDTDEDPHAEANIDDPRIVDDLRGIQEQARHDYQFCGEVYWQARKAVRRYKVAKVRFGPRKRFRGHHVQKKLKTKVVAGKRVKGFFIADRFVSA